MRLTTGCRHLRVPPYHLVVSLERTALLSQCPRPYRPPSTTATVTVTPLLLLCSLMSSSPGPSTSHSQLLLQLSDVPSSTPPLSPSQAASQSHPFAASPSHPFPTHTKTYSCRHTCGCYRDGAIRPLYVTDKSATRCRHEKSSCHPLSLSKASSAFPSPLRLSSSHRMSCPLHLSSPPFISPPPVRLSSPLHPSSHSLSFPVLPHLPFISPSLVVGVPPIACLPPFASPPHKDMACGNSGERRRGRCRGRGRGEREREREREGGRWCECVRIC